MLIDCFPFWMEYDVLDIRLNTLADKVDYFVLVEASRTQSLEKKPFFFDINKLRYKKFLDKIIHVKLYDEECMQLTKGSWQMENFQRNSIQLGLDKIKLTDDDVIMVSDADEIPNLEDLDFSKFTGQVLAFEMAYHTFFANLVPDNKKWVGTVIAPYRFVKKAGCQFLRDRKDSVTRLTEMGWHLGYMGGKDVVYNKFHSCIEPFDKSQIKPYQEFSLDFDRKIRDGGSFLFSDKQDDSLTLKKVQLAYPQLPKYLCDNQADFKHLLFE